MEAAIAALDDRGFETREKAANYLGVLARSGYPVHSAIGPLVRAYNKNVVYLGNSSAAADATAVAGVILAVVAAQKVALQWGEASIAEMQTALSEFVNDADPVSCSDARKHLECMRWFK